MEALGISLIVGGMAFFFSGLIFLLPSKKKFSEDERSCGQGAINRRLQRHHGIGGTSPLSIILEGN